jgi:hypothetical protein
VEVGILPGGALAVALRFFRTVVFEGKGAIYRKPAITWEKVSFGTHGNNTAFVMSTIDEMLDSFLNEYLKANPSQ